MYYTDTNKLLKPWFPVKASESGNLCQVKVLGREYTVSESCMPSSIISQGKELLASPIRIVATENGNRVVYENAQCF